MRCSGRGFLVRIGIALVLQGCLAVALVRAQSPDPLELLRRIGELSKAGRYSDAIPLGRQLVAEMERMAGSEHPMAAIALLSLADLHRLQGELDEAEPMLRRALAIREKAFGAEHPDVAQVLASLSYIAIDRAQYREAEGLLKRVLAIRQRELGSEHPDTLMTLVSVARVRHREARYGEAEALFQQALEGFREALGGEHAYVSVALNNLAVVYKEQGKLAAAEVQLREALRIQEATFGADSVAAAAVANNLGEVHVRQGRYAEAEILYRRTLQITERALGAEHPDVANQLGNLASLFTYQGRASEAEGLLRRALTITETALGPDHPDVATSANNLAHAISAQNRLQEAEALYRRSLAIREARFGTDNPLVAVALDNLAAVLHQGRRFADAEPLARRSLAIRERSLGPTHPLVGNSLNNLASLLDNLKRNDEAAPLLERALAVREAALGASHPEVAITVHNLASHHLDLEEWDAAYAAFKRASAIWIGRRNAGSTVSEEDQRIEMRSNSDPFLGVVVAAYHAAQSAGDAAAVQLRADAFESAQWVAGAGAASAIARMTARIAFADSRLSELVRERQDLAEQVGANDRALIAAASQPAQARSPDTEATLVQRAAASSARLKEIDAALAARFPEYASLTDTAPLPLVDAAGLVRPGEALLVFVPTKDATYLWGVTQSETRWVKIPLGSKALADHVKALRCGLDAVGEWQGGGTQRCMELTGVPTPPDDTGPRPFDLARAHLLYRALFGQIEDLIAAKHILVVASGPLTSLPFHVLVAGDPPQETLAEPTRYARADWLARRTAITVLPSVSSLGALRRFAQQSQASAPFIGFGNPLLSGGDGTDRRAWTRQNCLTPAIGGRPAKAAARAIARPPPAARRGVLADVDLLRHQAPLPETTDELCAVARLLGAPESSVYLGERATESTLKALSASGELKRARILHFATHGLLAGETEGIARSRAEPALMLTPPQQASDEDDGLLTASEVAQLKLDADWVVMSACNTAAGDKVDVEALSGLARAFFYAGSRALLVSHWYVDSDAAVALTSGAFAQLQANPSLGRAEALRRSMLALMDKGGRNAHPAYWAPFVVVGEGATTNTAPGTPLVTSAMPPAGSDKPLAQRGARAKHSKGGDWRSEIWRQ
jgi:CHAT domain-containing protein/tetratricopeptide (TPR) repeat protein